MATLESLELTIESNAKSAVQGIGSLIRSLSALSDAIGKPVNGLLKLNAELEKLKKYGNIKMPTIGKNFSNGVYATNTGKKKAEQFANSVMANGYYDPETNNNRGPYTPTVTDPAKEAEWQRQFQANIQAEKERRAYSRYMNNFYRERERLRKLGLFKEDNGEQKNNAVQEVQEATQAVTEYQDTVKQAVEPVKDMANANDIQTAKLEKVKAQTEKLTAETEKLQAQTEKIKESAESGYGGAVRPIERVTSAASKFLSRVGRIASTMLIRRAINAMLTGAKEGLDNYYQYSKAIGSNVASTMDTLTSRWSTMKNQLGAALGTALNTIAPILNTIASLALKAFNALTMLFALLNGQSTYSQAVEQATEYASATSAASAATKDLLASFDELNVIQSTGGGSSGSNPYSNITEAFQEVAIPQWLQEWKPIIEAIIGGTLGAIILPKIFEWIKKIFDLFGGSDVLDILKRMKNLKDTDFSTPTNGIDNFLKKFTDSDVLNGVGDVADLINTLKNLDWKTLLIKNLPELLKLAIEALTKLIQGLDVTSKVKVDRKEFDEYKKDFEQFKKDNKTLSVAVVFDHTRSSDFWRDKKTIDDWCNAGATKSIAIMTDHTRSSDFSMDKSTIDKWLSITGIKNIAFMVDHMRSSDYTRDRKELESWLDKTGVKNIAFVIDHTRSSDYTRDRKNLDTWLDKIGVKDIAFMVDHTRSSDYTRDRKTLDEWLDKIGIKNVALMFDHTRSSDFWKDKKTVDSWVSDKVAKYVSILFDHTRSSDFWRDKKTVDAWTAKEDTKSIVLKFVDNAQIYGHLVEWVNQEDTKVINIDIKTTGKVNKNGNIFDKNIFTISIEEALDYFKKNDLATIASDFWESLKRQFGFTSGKDNNNLGMNMSLNVEADKPSVQRAINYIEGFTPDMAVNVYNTRANMIALLAAIATWTPNMAVKTYNTRPDMLNLIAAIESWIPYMKVKTYNTYDDTKSTVTAIETWVPNIRVNCYNTKQNMENLMAAIETWHPNIVANVTTGGTYAMAEGGLVESGDIFVANENGKAEMIGRFGNQAAVANQEQMVEAMARGVQYAQAEQNNLLRDQNSILRKILAKEFKLGASSALGRIASQSLDLYERTTGG